MKPLNAHSTTEKIIDVADSVRLELVDTARLKLISLINELISKDFNSLIQLLYRIDVSEKKIKTFLDQNTGTDPATILADLIIERQLQKIESRKHFRNKNKPESDEEKW